MNVTARLPECAGQAADAVSAKTQSQNVQIFGDVNRDTSGRNLGPPSKILCLFLNEICMVTHPLAGLLWERQFENSSIVTRMGKVQIWEYLFVHRKQGLFLSVYVDDIKMAERRKNFNLMSKKLMKLVDLGEPTSFLDHVYLGYDQRECKSNESVIEEHKKMFESRVSAWATEKSPGWEQSIAKTVAWSYGMEGHAKKCVDRFCESAHKNVEQQYKVSIPCLDDHVFKNEELETVGEL